MARELYKKVYCSDVEGGQQNFAQVEDAKEKARGGPAKRELQ